MSDTLDLLEQRVGTLETLVGKADKLDQTKVLYQKAWFWLLNRQCLRNSFLSLGVWLHSEHFQQTSQLFGRASENIEFNQEL